ncbi:TonB-dependent siderophore receptor [Chitinasiproducens palmae]|uniref:Iron complex outermembrane recepter protein n=1 Tax=Chitinasiproducens palmae TaxID=1770053 RepID=A0A1H2PIX8_9BURK|nr:TonB-dependent siderophore receptor [Chitinasiproducens palmae]SDV46243.1 iron complex outermembrane recepter protein [Chitinasiproducens palmae]
MSTRLAHSSLARQLLAAPLLAFSLSASLAAAQGTPTQRYDIAAGTLDQVLNRYASQAGVLLMIDSALTAGRSSAGLHGRYALDAGFAAILADSGLAALRDQTGGYRLARVAASAAPATVNEGELSPVLVTGVAETARGPVRGYVASRSAGATKTDTPLLETPQSVSVVTRDQMDDQAVQSVREALRYTAGVMSEYRGGGGSRYDTVTYRGFGGGANYDYSYLDGTRLLGGNYAVPQIDPYNLERVEVVKGPASVLYGQINPGGMVNLTSKRPTSDAQHEIVVAAGNHGRWQGAFDLGGPVDQNGTVLYRLTGVARDSDTQTDFAREQRVSISPSLTFRPDRDTSLTLLANYQHDPRAGYFGFLPAVGTVLPSTFGRIATNFFDGDPNFDRFDRTQYQFGYAFEHRFDDVWTVRQNFRYMHMDTDYESVYTSGLAADGHTLTRRAIRAVEHSDALTLDNQAQAKFDTGPVRHTVLFGVDLQRYTESMALGTGAAPTLDILHPIYYQNIVTPALSQSSNQINNQIGVYAQDEIRLGRWALQLGARNDWATAQTQDRVASTTAKQADHAFTWRAGLLYLFDNGVAPYVSYATSFLPTSGTDAGGRAFVPTKGEQYEAGVKYQPRNFNGFFTASIFQLKQRNVLTTDPQNPLFSIQTGEVRVRGVELEAHAEPLRNLRMVASYTYLNDVVTASNDGTVGKRPAMIPTHMATLWLDYTLPSQTLPGLGAGAGVRYVGPSYGAATDSFRVPGVTLFDAAVHYNLGQHWRLAVNVDNLFDRTFVSSCATATKCFYGARRTVLGSARYQW